MPSRRRQRSPEKQHNDNNKSASSFAIRGRDIPNNNSNKSSAAAVGNNKNKNNLQQQQQPNNLNSVSSALLPQQNSDLLTFNCGGELIPIQKSVILRNAPNSFLALYIMQEQDERDAGGKTKNNLHQDDDDVDGDKKKRPTPVLMLDRDDDGSILLDRDPRLFRAILNYCRGYRNVGPLSEDEMRALLQEAEAWCLPELHSSVARHLEMKTGVLFSSSICSSSASTKNNDNNNNDNDMNQDGQVNVNSSVAHSISQNHSQKQQQQQQQPQKNPKQAAMDEIPQSLRFIRGPGVNVDRVRVRNNFTVGIVGDRETGAPMVAGVHSIHLEVQRCEYVGFGIMQDPVGAAVLPQDAEFHRMPGSVGYYYTGVYYSNCPTPVKEEKLGVFGAGSVLQMRLDMDERVLEFFVDRRWERLQTVAGIGRARFAVVMKQDSSVRIVSPERASHLVALQRQKAVADEERGRREAEEEQRREQDESEVEEMMMRQQQEAQIEQQLQPIEQQFPRPPPPPPSSAPQQQQQEQSSSRYTTTAPVYPEAFFSAQPAVGALQQTQQTSRALQEIQQMQETLAVRSALMQYTRPLPSSDDDDDGDDEDSLVVLREQMSRFADADDGDRATRIAEVDNRINTVRGLTEQQQQQQEQEQQQMGRRALLNQLQHDNESRVQRDNDEMRMVMPQISSSSSLPHQHQNHRHRNDVGTMTSVSRSLSRRADSLTTTASDPQQQQQQQHFLANTGQQLQQVEFTFGGHRGSGGGVSGPVLTSVPRTGSRSPAAFVPVPATVLNTTHNNSVAINHGGSVDSAQSSQNQNQHQQLSQGERNTNVNNSAGRGGGGNVAPLFGQQLPEREQQRRAGAPSRNRTYGVSPGNAHALAGTQNGNQQQRQPQLQPQPGSGTTRQSTTTTNVSPSPEPSQLL